MILDRVPNINEKIPEVKCRCILVIDADLHFSIGLYYDPNSYLFFNKIQS